MMQREVRKRLDEMEISMRRTFLNWLQNNYHKGTLEPDVISFYDGVIFSWSAPTKSLVQWDGIFPTITKSDDTVIDKGSQRLYFVETKEIPSV